MFQSKLDHTSSFNFAISDTFSEKAYKKQGLTFSLKRRPIGIGRSAYPQVYSTCFENERIRTPKSLKVPLLSVAIFTKTPL